MYRSRVDPGFQSRVRQMSRDRERSGNSEARRRAEQNAQIIRLLSAAAPVVGAGAGAIGGGVIGGLASGGVGILPGAAAGVGIGGSLGTAGGMMGNAYADYTEEKYRAEDEEAASRENQMYQLISMLR